MHWTVAVKMVRWVGEEGTITGSCGSCERVLAKNGLALGIAYKYT